MNLKGKNFINRIQNTFKVFLKETKPSLLFKKLINKNILRFYYIKVKSKIEVFDNI